MHGILDHFYKWFIMTKACIQYTFFTFKFFWNTVGGFTGSALRSCIWSFGIFPKWSSVCEQRQITKIFCIAPKRYL